MKPIVLEPKKYDILIRQLQLDYPLSVTAVRSKTKRLLGFTPRFHLQVIPNENYAEEYRQYERSIETDPTGIWGHWEPMKSSTRQMVYLDFYDEPMKTFFLLKYSEFL